MKNFFAIFPLCLAVTASGYDRDHVTFTEISDIARELAEEPYGADDYQLPASLESLDYDEYRNLRPRPGKALWRQDDLPFALDFFHLGNIHHSPVKIYEFTNSHVQEIPFISDFFDYRQTRIKPDDLPELPGYAGLRIKYPLNNAQVYDDLIVFQGASYFRALSRGSAYGLSARGLGVNIGSEEFFPRFTQFWLKKPKKGDKQLHIFALLEGKHVTGAYEFMIEPGQETVMDVHVQIWPRTGGVTYCFAPLTSMFFYGENTDSPVRDWRPEVHDSDGLLVLDKAGWLWSPLFNPKEPTTLSFPVDGLKGFGLLQRDRRFKSYEDLEARYDKRPTAWVTPTGNWPAGEVRLFLFPTVDETVDNANAYWTPSEPLVPGQPYDLNYKLYWRFREPNGQVSTVLDTFIGANVFKPLATEFIIEFSPPSEYEPGMTAGYDVVFDAEGAPVRDQPVMVHNPVSNTLRVFFTLDRPMDAIPTEGFPLSLQITRQGKPVSEKWSYQWTP